MPLHKWTTLKRDLLEYLYNPDVLYLFPCPRTDEHIYTPKDFGVKLRKMASYGRVPVRVCGTTSSGKEDTSLGNTLMSIIGNATCMY